MRSVCLCTDGWLCTPQTRASHSGVHPKHAHMSSAESHSTMNPPPTALLHGRCDRQRGTAETQTAHAVHTHTHTNTHHQTCIPPCTGPWAQWCPRAIPTPACLRGPRAAVPGGVTAPAWA